MGCVWYVCANMGVQCVCVCVYVSVSESELRKASPLNDRGYIVLPLSHLGFYVATTPPFCDDSREL